MLEGKPAHQVHGLDERIARHEGIGVGGRREQMRRRKLSVETRRIRARCLGHCRPGGLRAGVVAQHERKGFVPGTDQGFAELGGGGEGGGVHDHQIDDFPGNLAGIEDQLRVGRCHDAAQLGFPGDDCGGRGSGEGAHDIRIRRVDDLDVALAQSDAAERAHQQIVGHGELDQIDLLSFDVGKLLSLPLSTTPSLPFEKSPAISAVESTPPAAGMVSMSMLVMTQASKPPAVYWLIDST